MKKEKDNTFLEFVSYDGEYPNLCSGILTVKIDGKLKTFGSYYDKKTNYPCFWMSGGSASFDKDWNANVTQGEWVLEASKKEYPKDIWKLLPRLLKLMNDNVLNGCCGGCL